MCAIRVQAVSPQPSCIVSHNQGSKGWGGEATKGHVLIYTSILQASAPHCSASFAPLPARAGGLWPKLQLALKKERSRLWQELDDMELVAAQRSAENCEGWLS